MKKSCIAFLLFSCSISAYSATISNCTSGEQIIFSCTAAKKVISVCSAPRNAADNYMEYRFSANGKSTFAYRADQSNAQNMFSRATLSGASTSSTVLWFGNQGYFYVLSDPVKGFPALVVKKGRKDISTIVCKGNMTINLGMSNPHITERSSSDYFESLD